ncbi:MAG: family 16 glycoside hydrolase, partial [Ginsengibacter sp.]
MKKYLVGIIIFSFLFVSCHSGKISSTQQENRKWVSLFNGKNLDHWIPKIAGYPSGENFGNTFRVDNEILSTRYNAYDSFNKRFGALYYDKKFTNYRLKVEYRFIGNLTPGAPSWGFRDGGIQY